MLGRRTLLIDADMRKPTQRLRMRTTSGLCDYLAAIRPLKLHGSRIAAFPDSHSAPSRQTRLELLVSDRMKLLCPMPGLCLCFPSIRPHQHQQVAGRTDDHGCGRRDPGLPTGGTGADEPQYRHQPVERPGGNLCGRVNDVIIKAIRRSYRWRRSVREPESQRSGLLWKSRSVVLPGYDAGLLMRYYPAGMHYGSRDIRDILQALVKWRGKRALRRSAQSLPLYPRQRETVACFSLTAHTDGRTAPCRTAFADAPRYSSVPRC